MPSYGLLIDYEYCSGCHACEIACKEEHGFPVGKFGIRLYSDGPWQINNHDTNWNMIPVPTDLCDLCADRVAKNRKPTCVHHCLADVMRFGTVEELAIELERKDKQVLFVPRPNTALDWQEDIDRDSVVDKMRRVHLDVAYSDAGSVDMEGDELNKSFKLALQREEQKLDDKQKID